VVDALLDGGARAVVVRNEFTAFEKLLLAVRAPLDVIARGGIGSGWDVTRALGKGARAVQVGPTLGPDGVGVFARLEREMEHARGAHR
jgi:dihydroorotate dehydrogenase